MVSTAPFGSADQFSKSVLDFCLCTTMRRRMMVSSRRRNGKVSPLTAADREGLPPGATFQSSFAGFRSFTRMVSDPLRFFVKTLPLHWVLISPPFSICPSVLLLRDQVSGMQSDLCSLRVPLTVGDHSRPPVDSRGNTVIGRRVLSEMFKVT